MRSAEAPTIDPVELNDFLPFLIVRAASRITAYFNQATDWTDLTVADARALGAVWFKPGIRLAQLAEVTDITSRHCRAWSVDWNAVIFC